MKKVCLTTIIILVCILFAGCAGSGPAAGLPPAPTNASPTILDYDAIVAADMALYEPLTTSAEPLHFLLDYDAIVAADMALYEPLTTSGPE
jgi:hypothetical protein